jgi:two-component system cell cycle response regulator
MTVRVLIVGTVLARTRIAEKWLTEAGFRVVIATSGHDGLALCRRGRADVVVLEAIQPDLDGFGFCRRLKADDALRHLPIGLVTGEGEPRHVFQALAAQADECFPLPLAEAPFVTRMRSLADLSLKTDCLRRTAALGGDSIPTMEGTGARILVLDPEPRSRQRLTDVLSPEFAVTAAAEVQEAVACMARDSFDVAICDFEGLQGLGSMRALLLHQLRLAGLAGRLRLIGLGDEPGRILPPGSEMPVDDILLRPLDRSEVLARTRVAARKRAMSRAIQSLEAQLEAAARLPNAAAVQPQNRLAA